MSTRQCSRVPACAAIVGATTPLTTTTSPSRPRIFVIIDASSTFAELPIAGSLTTSTRSVARRELGQVVERVFDDDQAGQTTEHLGCDHLVHVRVVPERPAAVIAGDLVRVGVTLAVRHRDEHVVGVP